MPVPERSYTSDETVQKDGSVRFVCSPDAQEWPWLALPPLHPIVIQTQNFWTSVGASLALGTMDKDKWTALTWTDWECGDADVGHAVHGTFERTLVEDKLAFLTRLYDAQDREIVSIRGRGVVFRTRNFEEWRAKSKGEAAQRGDTEDFDYASHEALGLDPKEPPLVSTLQGDQVEALITRENGLQPGHPYFSGSGDHVNTPHLAEVARQVIALTEGEPVAVTGGEMAMHHYIELGCPFTVGIESHGVGEVQLAMSQLEKRCAEATLRWGMI